MKKKFINSEVHKFVDGELHIYQPNGSKYLSAKFYPRKKYKAKNIKSTKIDIAREIAYSWYLSFTKVHKHGKPFMAKSRSHTITDIHKYLDGKLHIYKQSNTKNWYARFFTEGKYKVKSLKETNFELAKKIAQEWYFDLQGKQKSGKPI